MAISLFIDSPSVTRDGGAVSVHLPIRATMTENYAYRMQIRVNGNIWTTGGNYQNISGTYVENLVNFDAITRFYHVEVYYQEYSAGQMIRGPEKSSMIQIEAATFTLTLDPGEGTVDTDEVIVTYGQIYGELPKPRRSEYRFLGWYTDEEDGDRISEDAIVSIEEDTTLYAHWRDLIGGTTSMRIDPDTLEIDMPRGDSEAIIVSCRDEPFETGDIIEFSVRKKPKTERLVHIVVDEIEDDGSAYIEIKPSDTENLDFGTYVYDIQLTKANGWVTHLVRTTNFILDTEVTYNG